MGAMIEGLQLAHADDDALLAQGMTLFDSLYRSFEQAVRLAGTAPLSPSDAVRPRRGVERPERSTADAMPARASPIRRSSAPSVAAAGARAALVRLCAAAFVAYCSYAICRTPLLPLFARELGAGPSLIGLVMGASTLTGIFLKLPAGALSDLLGRRRCSSPARSCSRACRSRYLAVSTLALLIVLRFVHGSATAIFGPVASASLSDIAPPASRGAWLSTYSTAQGAGQASARSSPVT